LRTEQSSQPLDATTAPFLGLVSQVRFERSPHGRPNESRQPPEVFDGLDLGPSLLRHHLFPPLRFPGALQRYICRHERLLE